MPEDFLDIFVTPRGIYSVENCM